MVLYLQTSVDPSQILMPAERILHNVDSQLPIPDARTGHKIIEQALWTAKMGIGMLSIFGAIALSLASVGLYGLMSYSVRQRQREISLRMALGAGRGQVLQLILRQGLGMVATGIAIGTMLSFAFGRAVSKMLYGISPSDPISILGASLVLLIIAGLACYLPARTASKLNPLTGLRVA
jgi:ABC-type antimicrobial peptide transport system permease subunit